MHRHPQYRFGVYPLNGAHVFIACGHRRARPGGAVILHYVGCEAMAHRRVGHHPLVVAVEA